ncbi:hypothetical protein FIBSPDRAFT_1040036 [Athelia psychrophila]|uniref:F-box domain-containing protein n=1 Tax=Athelia psychrophila TaxID=1759441 RepID=A0A166R1G4_9AGAM|nr:hypothetical protein FIBSPDRAFT_1040036 [Fibularhizoctonia sp. CBS 109695]
MPHDISKVLKIPPRLTDAIIGHLCGDTASVTACSLTCSAWTPPSQAHLFHDLKIPSSERANAIVSLLESSPHLALYPRTLEIHAQAGEDHMETVIPSIAPQLSEVRTLRYCGVQFCDLSDRATSALRSNFPQVRTLVFERCRFNSCDDLVALVLASTRVEKLWLNEAEWVRPVEESSVNPELWGASDTRSPLSCVTMRRVDRGMVECLLSPELRTRLDCMVLSPVNGRQRVDEFSGKGINLLCETLYDVEGKVSPIALLSGLASTQYIIDVVPSIPPSEPAIHSLHIKLDFATEPPDVDFDSWVCGVLAHLDSPAFSEVVLDISAQNKQQLDRLNFERVAKALAKSSFGYQNKVTINVECSLAGDIRKEEIGRRMGKLGQRLIDLGLIHIR